MTMKLILILTLGWTGELTVALNMTLEIVFKMKLILKKTQKLVMTLTLTIA